MLSKMHGTKKKLKHWVIATRQWVWQNITSLTLAGLTSLPPNTSAVTLVSITAETPCNNRNVGNAEKSTWPSYRNLRSLAMVTVLPTAIASSTLLSCYVGTDTYIYIFMYNITHPPVHTG